MSLLDELLSMAEAAELAGRAPVTMRRAAEHGRLEARRIGDGPGAVWVTTRAAVSDYLAYIASREWESVPQRIARPGGHPRRRRRRRASPSP